MQPRNAVSSRFCWIIQFAQACARKYGPRKLIASTRSKLSSVASRISARALGATPALFTNVCEAPIPGFDSLD